MQITELHSFPVDPYSSKYWVQSKYTLPPAARSQLSPSSASLMQPPRLPLQASNQTNVLLGPSLPATESQQHAMMNGENVISPSKPSLDQPTSRAPQKPVRLISNDLLPAFKQAVSGSDLNKVGLVEILKKRYVLSSFVPIDMEYQHLSRFPKVSKDVIRDTLSTVAVRHGAKEADKRWILIDPL